MSDREKIHQRIDRLYDMVDNYGEALMELNERIKELENKNE